MWFIVVAGLLCVLLLLLCFASTMVPFCSLCVGCRVLCVGVVCRLSLFGVVDRCVFVVVGC